MTDKQKIEAMMMHSLKINGPDRIKTYFSKAQLRAAGCAYFEKRFTHSVMFEGRTRTCELIPGKS